MKIEYEKGIYRLVSEEINNKTVYFIQMKKNFLYVFNFWTFKIFNVSKKNESLSVLKRHISVSSYEAGKALIDSVDLKNCSLFTRVLEKE